MELHTIELIACGTLVVAGALNLGAYFFAKILEWVDSVLDYRYES